MTEEKELIGEITTEKADSCAEERNIRTRRVAEGIRDLPDYTKIDDSGFFRDLWDALKDETGKIWRKRKDPAKSELTL